MPLQKEQHRANQTPKRLESPRHRLSANLFEAGISSRVQIRRLWRELLRFAWISRHFKCFQPSH